MTAAPLLLLASTSSSRRSILTATGFAFDTVAPLVDEGAAVAAASADGTTLDPAAEAQMLASAKAQAAAAMPEAAGRLVLGCDSVFELDGISYGKPYTREVAAQRWRGMRGRVGTLHSGHTLIDTRTGRSASEVASARIWFADVSEEEIEAYVATDEPLYCAGAFTVDGRAAALVERIEGDYHAIVGLSPATLRRLALSLEVPLTSLWSPAAP